MVLGKLPVPGRPTIWIIVGQEPTALAVGAGGGCLDSSIISLFLLPLWETARYRYSWCGWGLFGHLFSRLSFLFSFSLSLGDGPK